MNHRGVGDRWLSGQPVAGVQFGLHDRVEITGGKHDGLRGAVALLIALQPEPRYLVVLGNGGGDVRVSQSALRRVDE